MSRISTSYAVGLGLTITLFVGAGTYLWVCYEMRHGPEASTSKHPKKVVRCSDGTNVQNDSGDHYEHETDIYLSPLENNTVRSMSKIDTLKTSTASTCARAKPEKTTQKRTPERSLSNPNESSCLAEVEERAVCSSHGNFPICRSRIPQMYEEESTKAIGHLMTNTVTSSKSKRALMASLVNAAANTHNHDAIRENDLVKKACIEILDVCDRESDDLVNESDRVNALAIIANLSVNLDNYETLLPALEVVTASLADAAACASEAIECSTHDNTFTQAQPQPGTTTQHTPTNLNNTPTYAEIVRNRINVHTSEEEILMTIKVALNFSSCEKYHSILVDNNVAKSVVRFMWCGLSTISSPATTTLTTGASTQLTGSSIHSHHNVQERRKQACRVAVNLSTTSVGARALVCAGVIPCLVVLLRTHQQDTDIANLRRILVTLHNCIQVMMVGTTDRVSTCLSRGENSCANGSISEYMYTRSMGLNERDELWRLCQAVAARGDDDEFRAEKVMTLLEAVYDAKSVLYETVDVKGVSIANDSALLMRAEEHEGDVSG
eukprot:CFRG3369T1